MKGSATHLRAGLSVEMRARFRAASFEKESREVMARLRAVHVDNDGRVAGPLGIWKREKKYGYLKLAGEYVYVSAAEMRRTGPQPVRCGDWFSFRIQRGAEGPQAVQLRRCAAGAQQNSA